MFLPGTSFCIIPEYSGDQALGLLMYFHRDNLNCTTCSFNLGPCAGREFMRFEVQSLADFAIAKNFDQTFPLTVAQKPIFHQRFWSNLRASFQPREVFQVDDSIVLAKRKIAIPHTTQERDTLGKARLTTAKGAIDCPAGTSFLAFGTATGSFATTRTVATAYSSFVFM